MTVAMEHKHKRRVFCIVGKIYDEIMLYGIECAGIPVFTDKGNVIQRWQYRLRCDLFSAAPGKQSGYKQKRTEEQIYPAF